MTSSPVPLPIHSQILPGHNQATCQRLQTALLATPPYQIWVAVCDDLRLQRRLAATLAANLRSQGNTNTTQLTFDADAPDLAQQLWDWAEADNGAGSTLIQVLGIERLTEQGAEQQYQFLKSIRNLVSMWQTLECNLLLWVPRPWLKQIKRAAPSLCESVFEFMGDPTPLSAIATEQDHQAAFSPIRQWQFWGRPTPETPPPGDNPSQSEVLAVTVDSTTVPGAVESDPSLTKTVASAADLPTFSEELWQHLEADLVQLEAQNSTLLPPAPPAALPSSGETNTDTEADAMTASLSPAEPVDVDLTPTTSTDHFQTEPAPAVLDAWTLAYGWRDRVQAGDNSAATLEQAIQHYEALQPVAPQTPHRTEVLNDLGSLYWLWAQQTPTVDIYYQRLVRSCEVYEAALSPLSSDTGADVLTRLNSNLGSVYSLLAALQDPVQSLGKAIRAFHRALQYTPATAGEYATLQTHLGTAYWSLAQHTEESTHLHRAIAAYQEALRHSHPHQVPQAYAQLQNNLGIALWSLARHERPVFLLEQSIAAYRGALAYRTLGADPSGCAATHNNLGTALWDLGGHHPERSLAQQQAWEQAIVAYETTVAAAAQVPPETLGFDLWATHHSTGVVHDQLAITRAPDTAVQHAHLTAALSHYLNALTGWQSTQASATEIALQTIVRNLHLQARYLGVETQQRSLNEIPADWLPEIWHQL